MNIRSMMITAASVGILAIASSANAAAVNINIGAMSTAQNVMEDTNQAAAAAALADGSVSNYSDVTANALTSVNLASTTVDTSQDAWGLNGNLTLVSNNQMLEDTTNQISLALAGADGSVYDHSSVSASASALANTAVTSVTVTQK